MDIRIIRQLLGYRLDAIFPSIWFDIVKILVALLAISSLLIILSILKELKHRKKELLVTSSFLIISALVFISTGYLQKNCEIKKEDNFKKNVNYTYEEIFVPLKITSVSIEDYNKELLIDKKIYNIQSYDEIEVKKISSDIQGIVLYKTDVSSNTDNKEINERIKNFNENPIYILKEIRY